MVALILQRKKERNQKVLCFAVSTLICFQPIVLFINLLCRLIFGANFSLDTFLCYFVLACILLAGIKQLHFQIKTDALLFATLFALAYVLSYSFGENLQSYLFTQWNDFAGNPVYLLFVYSIPGYVFMRYITDYDGLIECFRHFSLVSVFCSLGSFILMLLRARQPEYMSFSYNLLFGTLFSLIYFLEKKKPLSLIGAVLGVVLIFLAGARGPVVCFLFGLFTYFIMSKASAGKKLFLVFALLAVGVVVLVLWQQILLALKGAVDSIGFSSRTIDLLMNGEISSDSGRADIQQRIIEGFTLFGRGLYGDREIGSKHYAHNLLIELISQWGFLFGTIIIVMLGVLFFKGFRTKNNDLRLLIIVLFATSVVKLMFSGSYLENNPAFFVVIAACVNSLDTKEALPVGEDAEPQRKKSKYIKVYSRYSS